MEKGHLIKEIQDLADRIKSNASDADSLLTDVTHLYEMVILLKHLPTAAKTNGQAHSGTIDSSAVQKEEPKAQITIDLFSEAAVSHHEAKEASPPPPPPAPKTEKVKEAPKRKKADVSVAEKLQHNKIMDLKSAIGINEKFQFINELFEGNMKEYTVAVDQINSFSTLEEAQSYIANLEDVYKWQPENHIAENFKELVERRFA